MKMNCREPFLNGNFNEVNCFISENQEGSCDPWIPRNNIVIAKYFCAKENHLPDSNCQNINITSKRYNSPMKTNLPSQKVIISHNTNSSNTPEVPHTKCSKILQHLRRFCETTSLRGVPRIINSRRPKFRILFSIFVTIFFIANFTCLFLLINQFRGYDVIHQPKTAFNTPADFPSITFCNLRPFSGRTIEYLKKNNMKTLSEFIKYFRQSFKTTMKHLNLNLSSEMGLLQTAAMSLNQFLMNLPPSVDIESIGHSLKSLIIDCRVSYINGSELSGVKCEKAGKWVLSRNEVFLNCYTLTLTKEFLKSAKAVDITLHIDDRFDFECTDCMDTLPLFQMTGIRFSVHTANSYPDVLDYGNNLSPGTFTEAVVRSKQWNMMEPPYGKCSKKLVDIIYSFEEGDYLYTLPSCKKYTIQQNLYKHCECIKYNYVPKNLLQLQKDKDVCTYIEQPVFKNITNFTMSLKSLERLFSRVKCRKDVLHRLLDDYSTCTVPCQYYTFENTISSGIYPTKSYHLKFATFVKHVLSKSIKDAKSETERNELQSILDKLHIYQIIKAEMNNGNITLAEKMLREANVIEKNFLTMQINRQDYDIIKVEEKAVISITSLLSQAGGMFSIWTGLTFFIVVEFLELVINVFETLLNM